MQAGAFEALDATDQTSSFSELLVYHRNDGCSLGHGPPADSVLHRCSFAHAHAPLISAGHDALTTPAGWHVSQQLAVTPPNQKECIAAPECSSEPLAHRECRTLTE